MCRISQGDSGGPAFCVDDTGEYVQVGITSWGAETIGTLIVLAPMYFFTIELFLIEFYIETI